MIFGENDQQHSPKVLCFGEALLDRLGPIGGVVSRNNASQDRLGGAPANVVCALAKLGIEVAFIGRIGKDCIGNDLRKLFVESGVNISCLQVDPLLPTRVVLVSRDINGERSFGGFEGDQGDGFADEAINLDELSNTWPLIASDAKWLLLGTIPLACHVSSQSLLWSVKQAKGLGIRIALDVNWRSVFWDRNSSPDNGPSELDQDTIQPLFEVTSLLKLSKEEAIWFFNSSDPLQISNSLSTKPYVVVTDGALPIQWWINGFKGTTEVPSCLPIVDTTGAGDCFNAGLISQILNTDESINSYEATSAMIRFAAVCGALVCLGAGAIDPQPTYEQVQGFLDSDLGWKS